MFWTIHVHYFIFNDGLYIICSLSWKRQTVLVIAFSLLFNSKIMQMGVIYWLQSYSKLHSNINTTDVLEQALVFISDYMVYLEHTIHCY